MLLHCVLSRYACSCRALKFSSSEKRQVYVTPTAYLELIQTYQTLLARKRKEVGGLRSRYDNGLKQLNTAGDAVVLMQEELTALKPALIKAKGEAEEMQVTIDSRSLASSRVCLPGSRISAPRGRQRAA